MLTRALILRLFRALNHELRRMGTMGELGLCGGAVMGLVFKARESTRDVDAIFRPIRQMRRAAGIVASKYGLPRDWLNDAVKGYLHVEPPREEVIDLSNLRVWAPRPDYLLAMKCVAARFDTHDRDDVIFLLRHIGLKEPGEVFSIIERYYPRRAVPAKTQFFVEEILKG